MSIQVPKRYVTSFSCGFLCSQIIAEMRKIKKRTQRDPYITFNTLLNQYFGVQTFPARDMKRCHLQKKICETIRDFKKALLMNYIVTLAFTRKIL